MAMFFNGKSPDGNDLMVQKESVGGFSEADFCNLFSKKNALASCSIIF